MIPRTAIPQALQHLARNQAWTLTRDQARAGGLSDRVISRLIQESWRQLAPGVYSLRPEPTFIGWCWAGLLLAGTGAGLGLAAAGHLYRLMPAPDAIAIWLPDGRQVRSRDPWVFRRGSRPLAGMPPRITIVRTVLDLAPRQKTDDLIILLAEAVGRCRVDPADLREALAALPRHPDRRRLGELLADVGDGVRSPLERHYLTLVERAHGLPHAVRQQSPVGPWATDVWYREFSTVVELDGHTWHEGPRRFRDFARDNRNTGAGLATLRVGWSDTLDRACSTTRQIVRVLRDRGWQDQPHDCRHCRGRRWL